LLFGPSRLGFRHGQCVYPAEEFLDWWYRPGLLGEVLAEVKSEK
jgi:hypothetical protein